MFRAVLDWPLRLVGRSIFPSLSPYVDYFSHTPSMIFLILMWLINSVHSEVHPLQRSVPNSSPSVWNQGEKLHSSLALWRVCSMLACILGDFWTWHKACLGFSWSNCFHPKMSALFLGTAAATYFFFSLEYLHWIAWCKCLFSVLLNNALLLQQWSF